MNVLHSPTRAKAPPCGELRCRNSHIHPFLLFYAGSFVLRRRSHYDEDNRSIFACQPISARWSANLANLSTFCQLQLYGTSYYSFRQFRTDRPLGAWDEISFFPVMHMPPPPSPFT